MPLTTALPRPVAPGATRPLHPPRCLRVAASFCSNRVDALRLMALLASHPGVQERQLALLSPADAAPQRFAACRAHWDRLRPSHAAHDNQDTPVPLALAGAMLGGLAGLVLATGLPLLGDVIAISLLAALAGGLISWQLQQLRSSSDKHRRFDQRLQRRLAQGSHAVVLVGVHDAQMSAQLLQAMRRGGQSWCAEVPLRRA